MENYNEDLAKKTFNKFKRQAIKKYGVDWVNQSKAQLTNLFYSKFIDEDKFKDEKQYEFCLMSDRYDNGKPKEEQIMFLAKHRQDTFIDELELNREAMKEFKDESSKPTLQDNKKTTFKI